jgi:hypothetical protein
MRLTAGSCLAAVGGGAIGLVVGGFIGKSIGQAMDGPPVDIGPIQFGPPSMGSIVVFCLFAMVGALGGAWLGAHLANRELKTAARKE